VGSYLIAEDRLFAAESIEVLVRKVPLIGNTAVILRVSMGLP
jgi:hypothetical protein